MSSSVAAEVCICCEVRAHAAIRAHLPRFASKVRPGRPRLEQALVNDASKTPTSMSEERSHSPVAMSNDSSSWTRPSRTPLLLSRKFNLNRWAISAEVFMTEDMRLSDRVGLFRSSCDCCAGMYACNWRSLRCSSSHAANRLQSFASPLGLLLPFDASCRVVGASAVDRVPPFVPTGPTWCVETPLARSAAVHRSLRNYCRI